VVFIIDKPEDGWKGLTGFIDFKVMKSNIPPIDKNHLMIACGPPLMMKAVRKDAFALGFKD